MRINSLRKKTPMLLSLALLLAVSAFAQTSASLSGTVHDPQGGAVAGAKVTLKDAGGTTQLETTTNSEGFYTFPIIQPATYTVTIEAAGFKKSVKSGIVVNASDRQSTGVTVLEVGDIYNTVEVTADAAQLQIKTESGEQGTAINNQQLQNLARQRAQLPGSAQTHARRGRHRQFRRFRPRRAWATSTSTEREWAKIT